MKLLGMNQSVNQSLNHLASCVHLSCSWQCALWERTFESSWRHKGQDVRRSRGIRTALHTSHCEAITFSHSSFISPNPCLCCSLKSNSQMSMEMKAIWCGLSVWCVSVCPWCRVQTAYLHLWAPQELEKALNLPTHQKSSLNPLFCFLNQVLQTPSTAPCIHPSIVPPKNLDFNDFSGF